MFEIIIFFVVIVFGFITYAITTGLYDDKELPTIENKDGETK